MNYHGIMTGHSCEINQIILCSSRVFVCWVLVKCSVATLAGGALTLGGIYSMWKLWSYFRNGCSTPDPMARAFSLFNEARVGSNFGAFCSQTGRYIPNFYNNVRDSVAPRFSSFFRRGDVEEDWTSVEMSDRSGCDSPRPRHGKDENLKIVGLLFQLFFHER